MGLILPNYMLVTRNFECKRCSFKFFKQTPSRVEKCPKCNLATFDINYKGETLDAYSQYKARIYSDESGQRHLDEIKNRKIMEINGKKVVANTDKKGRIIDYIPNYDVKGTLMGTKKGQGELK